MTVEQILDRVRSMAPHHVVVTGGEPLIASEVVELCGGLRADDRHVTVETAGTILPESLRERSTRPFADLMSISPKLASSTPPVDTPAGWASRHESSRRRNDVIRALISAAPYQLKFVIDTPADLAEAIEWLAELGLAHGGVDADKVCLMPQGRSDDELARTTHWLAAECDRLGFHFAPRHHVGWFGHVRGT